MRTKMLLRFPANLTKNTITYDLIKKYDLHLNILKAEINHKLEGTLVYDIDGNSIKIAEALDYLSEAGVHAELVSNTIEISRTTCVHCGLCTSVCPSKALTLDREQWALLYSETKCVGCNRCIPACPTRSIKNIAW